MFKGALQSRHIILEGASGSGTAVTATPPAARGPTIFDQLDPSVQAPWTSTTLTSFEGIAAFLLDNFLSCLRAVIKL